MAEWISVYCESRIELDVKDMREELAAVDLRPLAEAVFDTDEEAARALETATPNLRIERHGAEIEVRWKPAGPHLQIRAVTGAAAENDIAEVLSDRLPAAIGPGPDRVRARLARATQVVYLEMGKTDARGLGAVFGEALAFRMAAAGDGMVWLFDRRWAVPEERAVPIWSHT
ncbi:hypothetical protein [Nocardia bovistercoris]|uniref:Uncharacterized protein n=1 Tax=Nocardia bovistercoris TaxID=2785916 RepID=A0A931I7R1_9NOCA|nr:hypothetical protein [Nocardia bovistercoris]MBH0776414.1 hypothetical protein [Nocardia bovistercoris]